VAAAAQVLSLRPLSKPPAGVSFTASVTAASGKVTVEYEVVNRGDVPIVVFNGVPPSESTKPREPDRRAFYVVPSGADGLQLTKQVYGMPDGVTVYAPFTIGGTVVGAGGRTWERITVHRPLALRRPYQDVLGYGDLEPPDTVRSVDLCIGVAIAGTVRPRDEADPWHPTYGHDTGTASHQYVFCSGPHRLGM
jgi:hypothetical protein